VGGKCSKNARCVWRAPPRSRAFERMSERLFRFRFCVQRFLFHSERHVTSKNSGSRSQITLFHYYCPTSYYSPIDTALRNDLSEVVLTKRRDRMSKIVLQQQVLASSGVSFDESQEAIHLSPSLFERLGEDGLEHLSTLFYNEVFADKDARWFLNIFASSSKQEAIENQVMRAPLKKEVYVIVPISHIPKHFYRFNSIISIDSLFKLLEDQTCTLKRRASIRG
jgi:hypothetical protein